MTSGFWPIWPCLPHHLRSQKQVALLWNRRSQIFDDNLSLGVDAQYSMDTDILYSWSLVLELGLFLKILVVLQSTMITSGTGAKMCNILKGGKVWCCSEAVYWCLTVYKATGCEAPVCPMACGSNPVSTEVCYAEGNAVVSSKWLDIARHVRFDGSPSQGTVQIWAELTLTSVQQSWDVQFCRCHGNTP